MTKFNVGDRVRAVVDLDMFGDEPNIPVGTLGTITRIWQPEEVPFPYFVIFDSQNIHDYSEPPLVKNSEIEKWFDEPDTTPEQDAIDRAYARGYDDGYAQGFDDGIEMEF